MSDWVDLAHTTPLIGYAVHAMTVVNDDGVGPACYLQLVDAEGDVSHYLVDPTLASQLGWEIMGVVHGHADAAFMLDADHVAEQLKVYDYENESDEDDDTCE